MPWLRLDDGFVQHRKIVALTDREFRAWIRVLSYCARNRTLGQLPPRPGEEIPGLTKGLIERFRTLNLLDPGNIVHDWKAYNGGDYTATERQRRKRDNDRDSNRDQNRDTNRDKTVPRAHPPAGARRGPLPQPQEQEHLEAKTKTTKHPNVEETSYGKADGWRDRYATLLAQAEPQAIEQGMKPDGRMDTKSLEGQQQQ